MKLIIAAMLFTGMFLTVGSSYRAGNIYQVISSHPHDLQELKPHIKTVYQNGRLWVVKLKRNAPKEVMTHLKTLTGKEKSYLFKSPLTSELRPSKNDPIRPFVKSVSKERIKQDVAQLASYKTRASGTKENKEVIQSIFDRLSTLGYDVQKVCHNEDDCSVIADKKGSTRPEEVMMIMAHVDSVGEDFAGADDNASGTAVLLEMARVLSTYKNNKTIRFFVTNSEEEGQVGAAFYVKEMRAQKKLTELSFVLNMDMVGYNDNRIVEIETNPEFEDLAKLQALMAERYTNLKPKITLGAWGSDHVPFLRRGIPSLMIIENWETRTPCYHLDCDLPDTLNYDYTAEIGKMNLAMLLFKDRP